MTDLYLIAHKVRSEPAFDIATRIECAVCHDGSIVHSVSNYTNGTDTIIPCHECDGLGYWWIIPTSGHRAYPYWDLPIFPNGDFGWYINCDHDTIMFTVGPPPHGLPDHYTHKATPSIDLATALGFTKPKPSQPAKPFPRRI